MAGAAAAATAAGEREASFMARVAAAEGSARRDAFDAGAAKQTSELMEMARRNSPDDALSACVLCDRIPRCDGRQSHLVVLLLRVVVPPRRRWRRRRRGTRWGCIHQTRLAIHHYVYPRLLCSMVSCDVVSNIYLTLGRGAGGAGEREADVGGARGAGAAGAGARGGGGGGPQRGARGGGGGGAALRRRGGGGAGSEAPRRRHRRRPR